MAAAANLLGFCNFNSGSGWLVGVTLGRCSWCSERMISGSIRAIVGPSIEIWMGKFVSGLRRGSACSKCCRDARLAALLQNQSQELHTVPQSGKWSRGKFYKCMISIMYFGHCCYHPGIHNCCRGVSIQIHYDNHARPVAARPSRLGNRKITFDPRYDSMARLLRWQRNWNLLPHRHWPSWLGHAGIVSQMSPDVSWHRDTWSQPMMTTAVTLKVSLITICWHHPPSQGASSLAEVTSEAHYQPRARHAETGAWYK